MSKTKSMRIPAIKFIQHGVAFYQIVITPALLNFLKTKPQIKEYSTGKNGKEQVGYQRPSKESKVEEIGKYIADAKNHLIDPINLNIPQESSKIVFIEHSGSLTLGFVIISEDAILNVYDGGHRYRGAVRAWDLQSDMDFELPATLANRSEQEEILLFAIKNISADKIQSDLLIDLKILLNGTLKQHGNEERRFLPKNLMKDANWIGDAREIARLLNESKTGQFADNPWYRKMRYPNISGSKMPNQDEWFKVGKMAEYLRYVANNSYNLMPEPLNQRALVVCNMWKALQQLVPKAFTNASEYRLCTGHVSIEPIHRVLNSFMLYFLCDGSFSKFETFEQAAESVANSNKVPTVAEFVRILKECKVTPISGKGVPAPLFTEIHWANNGPSRHYHGKGNVSVLVNEINTSLGIPRTERQVMADAA
jgi:DGQHR domain-containing protein